MWDQLYVIPSVEYFIFLRVFVACGWYCHCLSPRPRWVVGLGDNEVRRVTNALAAPCCHVSYQDLGVASRKPGCPSELPSTSFPAVTAMHGAHRILLLPLYGEIFAISLSVVVSFFQSPLQKALDESRQPAGRGSSKHASK